MRKIITILIALVVVTASAPAFAEYLPGGSTQRDVVPSSDMLVSFLEGEGFVLSRLELREYSPDPVADLVEIATKNSQSTLVRSRAIQCLALYRGDERVSETLSAMIEKTRTSSSLFAVVLVSYAQFEGEDAAETVAQYLDAGDEELRMAAVVALGRFGGQAGYNKLVERQSEEQNARIQERIAGYVR